ncbi:uncharacterized protein MONBRDRAFT_6397 [Monosiga brevicollis MX1]|uniref:Uncharacterized protein n=1 Tax=Monosiga brevicollis TaxID=81824 RepID=A9UTR3_MONBE|nr:uncharacterized protein MONBRDRAFT_6397 [Monosiga brevicollis MX1]EDQ91535.1 predicted protein [Monosiga brevicollis MX1]|eukprot:XP_001743957.1 hypothetical protein [Monosiga brevicollis MX1]
MGNAPVSAQTQLDVAQMTRRVASLQLQRLESGHFELHTAQAPPESIDFTQTSPTPSPSCLLEPASSAQSETRTSQCDATIAGNARRNEAQRTGEQDSTRPILTQIPTMLASSQQGAAMSGLWRRRQQRRNLLETNTVSSASEEADAEVDAAPPARRARRLPLHAHPNPALATGQTAGFEPISDSESDLFWSPNELQTARDQVLQAAHEAGFLPSSGGSHPHWKYVRWITCDAATRANTERNRFVGPGLEQARLQKLQRGWSASSMFHPTSDAKISSGSSSEHRALPWSPRTHSTPFLSNADLTSPATSPTPSWSSEQDGSASSEGELLTTLDPAAASPTPSELEATSPSGSSYLGSFDVFDPPQDTFRASPQLNATSNPVAQMDAAAIPTTAAKHARTRSMSTGATPLTAEDPTSSPHALGSIWQSSPSPPRRLTSPSKPGGPTSPSSSASEARAQSSASPNRSRADDGHPSLAHLLLFRKKRASRRDLHRTRSAPQVQPLPLSLSLAQRGVWFHPSVYEHDLHKVARGLQVAVIHLPGDDPRVGILREKVALLVQDYEYARQRLTFQAPRRRSLPEQLIAAPRARAQSFDSSNTSGLLPLSRSTSWGSS